MSMCALWVGGSPGMFHASLAPAAGAKQHVVVERLPNGAGWDWVAWRADSPERPLHGFATTRQAAMLSAERALLILDGPSF